ncbi:MAG: component of SufBCD complex [Pseudomonadota bacterium]
MDWYQTVFELIDMRSFSNLWYWISLAVVWSTASHWVLGVPFDMVLRAKRQGGQAEIDMLNIVSVNVRRMQYIGQVAGIWIVAIGSGVLTTLAILGFVYWVEFAQAIFLLAFPMSLVGLLSLRAARLMLQYTHDADAMRERLTRHRLHTQLIGVVSIFVTSLFGMWQNISVGPLGG